MRRAILTLLLFLGGWTSPAPTALTLGFTPAEDARTLMAKAEPLVRYLSTTLGVRIVPQTATDYAGPIEALRSQKLDIALLGPKATLLAHQEAKATIIARTINGQKPNYYAIVFVRADAPLRRLEDLKNRTFAFVDINSASGGLFPRYMLQQHGVSPERDLKQAYYAGAHDAVILAVLHRKVDAGATWSNDPRGETSGLSHLLKTPAERRQLRVIAASPPIPGEGIVTRSGLPPRWRRAVQNAFVGMGDSPAGRAAVRALSFSGFVPATARDYRLLAEVTAKVAPRPSASVPR